MLGILFFSTFFYLKSSAQSSVCPIGVGTEPKAERVVLSPESVYEAYFPYYQPWANPSAIKQSDDAHASVILSDIARSRVISGNDFGFKLPPGSVIQGITLIVEGKSDLYKNIDEIEVLLTDRNGDVKGSNKKNTAKGQQAWNVGKQGDDTTWSYGSAWDTWGASWTAEDINSANFGFKLQIRSITEATTVVEIDHISIIVDYLPPYSFCNDSLLTFYIDKYEKYGFYVWDFPKGFDLASATVFNQTIDLRITDADYGLHTICVDVYKYDGSYAGTCCRDILYKDCSSGTVSGFVWEDNDYNGLYDLGEPKLPAVSVSVFNKNGSFLKTVGTDATGSYKLDDLALGDYYLVFDLPSGYHPTWKNSSNSNYSKVDGTGKSELFSLFGGQNISIHAGIYRQGRLIGQVWEDENGDGVYQVKEKLLFGKAVKLSGLDGQGAHFEKVTSTDLTGQYQFAGIKPGQYEVEFLNLSDYSFTKLHAGPQDVDNDAENGIIPNLLIYSGDTLNHLDAGIFKKGSLAGVVWHDIQADGVRQGEEPTMDSIRVDLFTVENHTRVLVATTWTDKEGSYLFENLSPGNYEIEFDAADTLFYTLQHQGDSTVDSDARDGVISDIQMLSGQHLKHLDAGLYSNGFLTDFIWIDTNTDGIFDIGEPFLSGARVDWIGVNFAGDTIHQVTYTDDEGRYYFNHIAPGNYELTFQLQQNYRFLHSVITRWEFQSGQYVLGDGLPVFIQGNVSGVVWQDVNNSKFREVTEPGLADIHLSLFTIDSVFIAGTQSDSIGNFTFKGVPDGSYFIEVNIDSQFVFVPFRSDSSQINSLIEHHYGYGTTGTLVVDDQNGLNDLYIGLARKISIGDFVWSDDNDDGLQNGDEVGIQGIEIKLINEFGEVEATTFTDEDGHYLFEDKQEGRYAISFVKPDGYLFSRNNQDDLSINSKADENTGITEWFDFTKGTYDEIDAGLVKASQIDGVLWVDLNGDGIRQSSEPGLNSIQVILFDADSVQVAQRLTNGMMQGPNSGFYSFKNLRPGDYFVKFDIGQQYRLSPAHRGSPDKDSDIVEAHGAFTTDFITLSAGSQANNIDGGVYLPASIGDLVWHDVNKNGIQDEDELGIPHVTVELYTQNGALLSTVETDEDGKYKFDELKQGVYYLQFGLISGYDFSPQYQGQSREKDSDVDKTGTSHFLSLAHGIKLMDLDAGMVLTDNYIVLGRVWNDINRDGIRTANESAKDDAQVLLLDINQQIMHAYTTNHAGMYALATANDGSYYVQVQQIEGLIFSPKNVGADRKVDYDVDENGTSDPIYMDATFELKHIDAGMFVEPTGTVSGVVFLDHNKNGIRDIDDSFLEDVVIFLFTDKKKFVKSIKTNALGQYTLKLIDPGFYYCLLPQYQDKDFVLYNGQNTDVDSEFTNEYGVGTSRLFKIESGASIKNFDFGYQLHPGIDAPYSQAALQSEVEVISIYPNPCMSNCNILIEDISLPAQYYIQNTYGKIVSQGEIESGTSMLGMENLDDGQYTVIVISGDRVWTRPLIKLRN